MPSSGCDGNQYHMTMLLCTPAAALPHSIAETLLALWSQPTMMELCHATVTLPAPREMPAIQWEDSVPVGNTSSAVSAQSVPQDTMVSPTAGVSEPCTTSCLGLKKLAFSPSHSLVSLCSVRVWSPTVRRGDGELHLPPADSETGLRYVRGPDIQLPPSAGLRGLRLFAQRHQRQHQARV